jgi:DNA invertase Pin-like site-specific DNA recombinase
MSRTDGPLKTPAGKAMFQMMGVFAEFERSMIQERIRAGLRRAKAGETIRGAAEKFNVNPSTVQRLKHPFDAVAAPA